MLAIARALLAQSQASDARRAIAGLGATDRAAKYSGSSRRCAAKEFRCLLVEQNARMSLEIADLAYVLDDGQVVYSGPARELAADEARVRALAGASAEEWTHA